MPIDAVFPRDQTTEERNEQSAAMMVDSQNEATAAALVELGYDVNPPLSVHSLTDDSAANGILEAGDIILEADGETVTDAADMRDIVNAGDGDPIEIPIERDGEQETVSVTPKETEVDGETTWLLGVSLTNEYDFPFDVTIQLNNVGGPSAGMMFALGIIDVLTPEELNGGESVAGTGTITADGTVGPSAASIRRCGAPSMPTPTRPRARGELRRSGRSRPGRSSRVLGRDARRRPRRPRRDPGGRRPRRAPHVHSTLTAARRIPQKLRPRMGR